MPEAFAVLAVFFISCLIYVVAKVQSRNPEFHRVEVRLEQLNQQRAWLEERLRRAERENWSGDMRQPIADELELTLRKQSELSAPATARS